MKEPKKQYLLGYLMLTKEDNIGGHDYDHPMDLAGHWGSKKSC